MACASGEFRRDGIRRPRKNKHVDLLSSSGGSPEALLQANPDTGSSNSNYDWEADPTWTPDGKYIIFGKTNNIGNSAIYRLDLKTRNASSIPGTEGLFSPRLSPDGRYISALTIRYTKLMLFDTNTNRSSSLLEGGTGQLQPWSPVSEQNSTLILRSRTSLRHSNWGALI